MTWDYDALGRPVWDPVTSAWLQHDWSWDEDPTGVNPPWHGVRHQVSDPQGTTRYSYAPDPAVGGFGWVTGLERTYLAGPAVTFAMSHDADGREVSKLAERGGGHEHLRSGSPGSCRMSPPPSPVSPWRSPGCPRRCLVRGGCEAGAA